MSEFLAELHPAWVCLLVCVAKIVEISIQSLKTCMMVKGQRLKAAGLGFLECTVWGLVISTIIGTLGDNLFLLLFYCVGYATGLFLGSTIEGKIALGTSSLELIVSVENTGKIITYLRQSNRGYTVFSLDTEYTVNADEFLTMGRSSPFTGDRLFGKCVATVMGDRAVYLDPTLLK